jgi:hypothetical protein
MQIALYCVFDTKLGEFNTPMAFQSRGVAIRSFMDEVKSGDSMLHKHPEDFSLYYVGTFDSGEGKFEFPDLPEWLISGQGLE